MVVDVIEHVYDRLNFRHQRNGHFFVMRQKMADDYVRIALFDEFGIRLFQFVQGAHAGQKLSVVLFVGQVRRKRFRAENARKIVGVARAYDQHVIGIGGRGLQRVHAAFVHEHDVVPVGVKSLSVDLEIDASLLYVQYFDTAVKVRRRIHVFGILEGNGIRFVVPRFIKEILLHNVNIR